MNCYCYELKTRMAFCIVTHRASDMSGVVGVVNSYCWYCQHI